MIQTFFTRFLFRCCPRAGIGNRNRRKGVDLKVVISNDVLPFPSLSSEWYARQQKPPITLPESRLEEFENDKDPRVFPALSKSWHQRRAKLLVKSDSRKEKSKAKGSLEENIANLETKALTNPSPNVRKKCTVILHVAKYLLANGPVMQAKELGNVYTKKKNEVLVRS